MSWQAVRRVMVAGPDDDKLWRLLVVVADFADESGRHAAVGVRLAAVRCHAPRGTVHRLLKAAVDDDWLAVADPGGPRRRAVYNLGPRLQNRRVMSQIWDAASQPEHEFGTDTSQTEHEFGTGTDHRSGRVPDRLTDESRPAHSVAAVSTGHERTRVPLHPSERDETVENERIAEQVAWAKRWLETHPDVHPAELARVVALHPEKPNHAG